MRSFLTLVLLWSAVVHASSLDRHALEQVLQRATPAFKRCYERALERYPELAGRVSVRLEIAASGRVTEVTIEFSEDAPELTQCLRAVATKLQFLKGPAPYKVVWPVVFKTQ